MENKCYKNEELTAQEVQDFCLWLEKNGKAWSTIRNKKIIVKPLLLNLEILSEQEVQDYLFKLQQKGYSGKYLNTIMGAMSLYFQFKGLGKIRVKFFKEKENYKTILSNEEIHQLINVKPTRGGLKETANWNKFGLFFKILAYTGMRPGEVAKLTKDDIDLYEKIIIIRESKTGRFRIVPINETLFPELVRYITNLESHKLFPAVRGGAEGIVRNVDWSYHFGKRKKLLGLNKPNVSVYSLRFSFITRLLSNDVNLFKVQRIVGHTRVEQTAHYTRYVSSDLFKAVDKDTL